MMIKIDRGPESADLDSIRSSELVRVRKIAETRTPTSDDIKDRYSTVKQTLYTKQSYKCCFCEFKETSSYNDVEHFRPKTEANRLPGSDARHGYWWLAWSWENLLFACATCNRSHKRTLFPLNAGSVALEPEQQPPGQESPLLIDPFREDPIDHIIFKHSRLNNLDRWIPVARNGSLKGDWTIRITRLDRDELIDHYVEHVDEHVQPKVKLILEALESNNPLVIQRTWKLNSKQILNIRQRFTGLSYDALDYLIPEAVRIPHNLSLIRPGM